MFSFTSTTPNSKPPLQNTQVLAMIHRTSNSISSRVSNNNVTERIPKQSDLKNKRVPSIISHHHSQAHLNPQSIIYSYNYPFKQPNIQRQQNSTSSNFFNRRKQRVSISTNNGQDSFRNRTRSNFNFIEQANMKQQTMVASIEGMTTTNNSGFAQQVMTRYQEKSLVDLQEIYSHYKQLDEILIALKDNNIESLQRCIDSYQQLLQKEKIKEYKDLFLSKDKQRIMNLCQCLEILFIFYLDLMLKEYPLLPQPLKNSFKTTAYYINQNYLSFIEIILYRVDKTQRSNKWALHLIDIVANLCQGRRDEINIYSSQVHQKQCLVIISDQIEIIKNLFLKKILLIKVKSFTNNFIHYVNNLEFITPSKINKDLRYLLQTNKNKRLPTPKGVEEGDDEVVDMNFEYESPFALQEQEVIQIQQQSPPEIPLAYQDHQVNKMHNYLSKQQEAYQGGYLPKLAPEKEGKVYTLVVDLDETLIHFDQEAGYKMKESHDTSQSYRGVNDLILYRPFMHEFLSEMAQYYEVVIFTAALQDYADYILDQIDPTHTLISYRLYRHHATVRENDGVHMKDLSKLGRDLKKVIILDNVKENFTLQRENGIFIKTWINDESDSVLKDLIPLLKQIVEEKVVDVRVALRIYRDSVMRYIQQNKPQTISNLSQILKN